MKQYSTSISVFIHFFSIIHLYNLKLIYKSLQVFPINGTNLDLKLSSVKIENDIYFFESNLILNSCYVEFKGKISKSTLTGQGQFVFDQDTAVNIAKTSNESIEPYQKRIETIQNLILK